MMPPLFKISIRIGLVTAAIIVLYELTNLLLVYHYFKYEYYISGAVIIALVTGVILTNWYHRQQAIESVRTNGAGFSRPNSLRDGDRFNDGLIHQNKKIN